MSENVAQNQREKEDIKRILVIIWRGKFTLLASIALGLLGACVYMFVFVGFNYMSEMVIDLGYVTDNRGNMIRKLSSSDVVQHLKSNFVDSKKYTSQSESAKIDKIDMVRDQRNAVLPYVKVVVVGSSKESVLEKDQEVLEFVQSLNEPHFQIHAKDVELRLIDVKQRLEDMKSIDNKIDALDSDIAKFRENFKMQLDKGFKDPNQTLSLATYMSTLEQSMLAYEMRKKNIDKDALETLERSKYVLEMSISDEGMKNAYVLGGIKVTDEKVINAKKSIVILLGLICGAVLGVIFVFGREFLKEFKGLYNSEKTF